jgi:hypothetical protein
MAPFYAYEIRDAIGQIRSQIGSKTDEVNQLTIEHVQNVSRIQDRLSQQISEADTVLLLNQNDDTVSQIRKIQEDISHMERRVVQLTLCRKVAIVREEYQHRLAGGFV